MLKQFTDKLKEDFIKNGAINIVCLGDSVTQGRFAGNTGKVSTAYPSKLRDMLNFFYPARTFNVINSGIGGTTANFALTRLERDVFKYEPDLVLVMFGVNDYKSIETYCESLKTIFTELNNRNIPCIFITEHMMNTKITSAVSQNDSIYAEKTMENQNNGTMDKLFEEGKRVAKECNVHVCDIYAKWKKLAENGVDTTRLLANGINHPVPEMHTIVAYEVLSMLLF